MILRTALVSTAAILCHLLPASALVTSQTLADEGTAHKPAETRPARDFDGAQLALPGSTTSCAPGLVATELRHLGRTGADRAPLDSVTICARSQEKSGDTYTLNGDAEIHFRDYVLAADRISYDDRTSDATLAGHVHLTGGPYDEDIQATKGTYNTESEKGTLENVVGSVGLKLNSRRTILTSSNPFVFTGSRVDKTGAGHYIVHDGTITVCDQPVPAWDLKAQRVIVEVGENAQVYHSTFRLRHFPMFYLPYASHPVDTLGRETGFLIPTLGISSRKGTTIGDAFYWAINRSADATVGGEYFSRRGWSQHGNFRWRPSDTSFVEARYFGVLDRGAPGTGQDQGGEDLTINAAGQLPWGVRAVANIEYLSSFVFRLAFNENFSQAVNSEVKSTAFLSKSENGFFFNTSAQRYQNFESTNRGDLVTILHAPSFETSSADHALGHTRLQWSYEAAAEGLSRTEPGFVTDPVVGRFDLSPRLAAPLFLRGWSFRPEVALRDTYYSQSVQANGSLGIPVASDLNRHAVETTLEVRPPSLGRVFERKVAGRTLKHVIEPRLGYRYVNGVDNFSQVIRFDVRDIYSNTNEAEYGIVNRLYAKRYSPAGNCPPQESGAIPLDEPRPAVTRYGRGGEEEAPVASACDDAGSVREIVTWQVGQKAFFNPTFGGAIVNGRRNVLTTTADMTGIAFLTEPRNWSPVISRLRINTTASTDLEWNVDYDQRKGRMSSSILLATWRIDEFFFGGSHAFLHVPGEIFVSPSNPVAGPDRFNQFRVLAGYGHPNKRGFSAAGNIGFDANVGFLQYSTGQIAYNWDCMGLSLEYRRLALGSVRNENQFRFSLSLANIGTFGTLRRQERLF